MSNRGYSRFRNLIIVGCFSKKRLTKGGGGGHGHPRTPPPPPFLATPLLRTNSIKCYIDKTNDSPLCRLCGKSSENVWHVVSGCSNLAKKDYKKRHDKVSLRVHWESSKKNLDCGEK